MNIKGILHEAERRLRESGSPSPRLDGEVILGWCLGADRINLYAHSERNLNTEECDRFNRALERRMAGEPVAYIVGKKEFWSLSLVVNRNVLIPRPDTETVVEETLDIIGKNGCQGTILEIGTGSGAISIALACELPGALIVAVDKSAKALALARHNAHACSCSEQIFFLCADLFESLCGKFAIVVSNPPYIAVDAWRLLPRGVRDFEPAEALVAGSAGTEFHALLISGAASFLREGGWLVMEIGDGQRRELEQLFRQSGAYGQAHFRKDAAGMDRVVAARRRSQWRSG